VTKFLLKREIAICSRVKYARNVVILNALEGPLMTAYKLRNPACAAGREEIKKILSYFTTKYTNFLFLKAQRLHIIIISSHSHPSQHYSPKEGRDG